MRTKRLNAHYRLVIQFLVITHIPQRAQTSERDDMKWITRC